MICGAVQGVGFRPFVYRLATELGLNGWVLNSSAGVAIEAEGTREALDRFRAAIEAEKPPRASIQSADVSFLDPVGDVGFAIRDSDGTDAPSVIIQPDIATCAECVREIFDRGNRRYRHAFTNCTNCGPRFTIIEALPYDRENTSMQRFTMCPACSREYGDPRDRRFDAQPIACPDCGPQLALWDAQGSVLAARGAALRKAAEIVREGNIVAVKGVGGFHLIVDARDDAAVQRLRSRKRREEKPFAAMYPSLARVRQDCHVTELEARLLCSPEAPIVLLERANGGAGAASVAPGNPMLGVMLPSTPLHHLLMADLGFPIVATSGNVSDEPMCIDECEALERLRGIADVFLVHDRPIVRHMDDSIVQVVCGREMVLRRARGYTPLPVRLAKPISTTLAVGGHLKNTVALGVGRQVFISQHIGDLATAEAHAAFYRAAADLPRLYAAEPEVIACDLHPDYVSSKFAATLPVPLHRVQHHWAHVLACAAENEIEPPFLGVCWDGAGLGFDGTIWGGEFLVADGDAAAFQRVAHLRQFRLPGGEAAIRQPARTALGVLFEMWGSAAIERHGLAPLRSLSDGERAPLAQMLAKAVNAPLTSSAGRLFDAVASLLDLRQRISFEGQAAMLLEFAVTPGISGAYPFELRSGAPRVLDWQPMIEWIISDIARDVARGEIAAKFHHTLADMIVAVARTVGEPQVILTGGCFQNRYLTECCVARLAEAGFEPYWHRRVPSNDGGTALGQVIAAGAMLARNDGPR